MNLGYRFIQYNLKWYFPFFFKKVYFNGLENIPKNAPVIYAVNHQNTVIDAILTGTPLRKELNFLVKSDAFKGLFLSSLLKSLKLIPIYRRNEVGISFQKQNQSIFNQCCKALEKNKSLLIFPEGLSSAKHSLTPLKKGVSRIALQAIKEYNVKEVYIIPVAINFENHFLPNSRIWINYLSPIVVSSNTNFNVNTLTSEIESDLKRAIVNLPTDINLIQKYFNNQVHHKLQSTEKAVKVSGSYFNQFKVNRTRMPLSLKFLFYPYEWLIRNLIHVVDDEDYYLSILFSMPLLILFGHIFFWIALGIIGGFFWWGIGLFITSLYLIWIKRLDSIDFRK